GRKARQLTAGTPRPMRAPLQSRLSLLAGGTAAGTMRHGWRIGTCPAATDAPAGNPFGCSIRSGQAHSGAPLARHQTKTALARSGTVSKRHSLGASVVGPHPNPHLRPIPDRGFDPAHAHAQAKLVGQPPLLTETRPAVMAVRAGHVVQIT